MNKAICITLLLISQCCRLSVYAQAPAETLTNKSVIELQKAGFGKDLILSKIETSACKFDVTTNGMVQLKKAGVEEEVINAMVVKNSGKQKSATATATNTASRATSSTSAIPEPDIINLIHFFDKPAGKITPLEKATAQMRSRKKALGYGGVNFVFELKNDKSPVRLPEAQATSFIVNTAGGAADAFVLYKLQIKNGLRQAVATNFSSFGDMKGSEGVIAVNIKILKPGVFEMMPATKLEKGEYFFANKSASNAAATSNADVYAFGVD